MGANLRVLMVTSEWPTTEHPEWVPFIVQQVEFLRFAGVDLEVFHFRGERNPMNYLRSWRRMRQGTRLGEFDLVHAQFGQSGLLGLPKQVPLVVTFHGSDVQGIVGSNGHYTMAGIILKWVSWCVAWAANEVIVVSEHLAKNLPRRPYQVIPVGLDLNLFRPIPQEEARRKLGLPLGKHLVLFAADPNRIEKRYSLAQQVVTLLNQKFDAELVVASELPHRSMPLYMSACDALLLTSLHEGSPTVVKEALACDLPVVSVDVGDVRLRIGSIEGCIVSDDDRAETIAAGLVEVLRRRARINGRIAVQGLDERLLIQKLIQVYERAMKQKR